MARRGNSNRGQRDASSPSLAELLAPVQLPEPVPVARFTSLLEVEDGRRYTPDFDWPLKVTGARSGRLRIARSVRSSVSSPVRLSKLSFDDGERVIRCVRRKQRREVMFAKKKFRKGAGSKRRRNFWSNVSC